MSAMPTTVVQRGDVVEVSGRRVGDVPRLGEIVEVLGEPGHEHYRIRWEDSHESILYTGEATSIRPRRRRPSQLLDFAAATRDLVTTLRDAGIEFELLAHRRTTTASSEARVLGLLPQEVAKTVIARTTDGSYVRAVVPASRRVSLSKLAAAVSVPRLSVLDEPELVTSYPQFELGAVPPFGGPAGDTVVIDYAIAGADNVVFDAGVHDTAVRIDGEALVGLAGAITADIAE